MHSDHASELFVCRGTLAMQANHGNFSLLIIYTVYIVLLITLTKLGNGPSYSCWVWAWNLPIFFIIQASVFS